MITRLVLSFLNHLLGNAHWARCHLLPFAGRKACLVAPPLTIEFAIAADGLLLASSQSDAPADVRLTLPGDTLLQALQGLHRPIAHAHVEGNAEFATALSFVFRNLSWDIEEDLSRIIGDIAAHRLVAATQALGTINRQTGTRIRDNITSLLVDEFALLVTQDEAHRHAIELNEMRVKLRSIQSRVIALQHLQSE